MHTDDIIVGCFYTIAFTLIGCAIHHTYVQDRDHPYECVSSKKIALIPEVDYRSARLQFEDGTSEWESQGKFKPGDSYCFKYERKH